MNWNRHTLELQNSIHFLHFEPLVMLKAFQVQLRISISCEDIKRLVPLCAKEAKKKEDLCSSLHSICNCSKKATNCKGSRYKRKPPSREQIIISWHTVPFSFFGHFVIIFKQYSTYFWPIVDFFYHRFFSLIFQYV